MNKFVFLIGVSATAMLLAVSGALAASAKAPGTLSSDTFASFSAGLTELSDTFGSVTGPTMEGAASGAYNLSPMLGVQGDVVYRTQDYTFDQSTLHEHDFEAAGHVFSRNEQGLLGAFVQYGEGALGVEGFEVDLTHMFAGAEAQFFIGNDATLYAQGGYKRYHAFNTDVSGWFGTFEARYFLQPNFKIEAHIGAETLDDGSDGFLTGTGGETTISAGVGAEYRVDNTPFSIFAKYDFAQNSLGGGSESLKPTSNRILIGAKFNFDAPTLLERDRSGASLKPVESHDFDYGA